MSHIAFLTAYHRWRRSARFTRILAIVFIGMFLAAYALYYAGARINRTHSLPKGIYWVVDKEPERGDTVSFWPRDSEEVREAVRRGYLIPGPYNKSGRKGFGLILKKLMALPGDVISITDTGVFINGTLIPNTIPLAADNIGDPLPTLRFSDYRLADHEALFLSDHLARSFDGRYFGLQDMRQIISVLRPVWVW